MDPDSLLHAHRKTPLDSLLIPNRTTQTSPPPPPAYTPIAPPTNPHQLLLPITLPITLPTSTLLALPHTTNDDDDDLPPPITIKIDATLKIVGHGNVLAYSPTETATRAAALLATALRQARALEAVGGGEARPVEISVGAGVSVVGCRNVVGAVGVRGNGVGKGVEKGVEKGAEGKEEEGKGKEERKEEGVGSGAGRKREAEEVSGSVGEVWGCEG